MSSAALFTRAEIQEQSKCPLMDARKMEHYSAITEEEILLFVTPEGDLEGAVLSEIVRKRQDSA